MRPIAVAGCIIIIGLFFMILTGCGKKVAEPEYGVPAPMAQPTQALPAKGSGSNPLYLTESVTPSGLKCVTATYVESVALSCGWK